MTLITNEIRLLNRLDETLIIATADRRLTYEKPVKGKGKYGNSPKLYFVPYLRATVSFWGNYLLKNGEGYFSWIPRFIMQNTSITNLEEFANKFRNDLNRDIGSKTLMKQPSGFHFSGFDGSGKPDFLHFSNCHWTGREYIFDRKDFVYRKPASDFLGRDVHGISLAKNFSPTSRIYRNGDFAVHHAAWTKLDEVFDQLALHPSFSKLTKQSCLSETVKFKLKFIGACYNNFAQVKNVGGPFDVVIMHCKDGEVRLVHSTINSPSKLK